MESLQKIAMIFVAFGAVVLAGCSSVTTIEQKKVGVRQFDYVGNEYDALCVEPECRVVGIARTTKTLYVKPPVVEHPAVVTPPPVQVAAVVQPDPPKSFMVNFQFAKSNLTKQAREKITEMLPELRKAKKIVVNGRTDSIGGKKYNDNLAVKRAETITQELVRQGISAELIEKGDGLCCYLVDNKTAGNRAVNRRAEIVINF